MNKRNFIRCMAISGPGLFLMNPLFSSAPHKTMSMLKEASYVIETPKGLRCLICPNECTLKEGEMSDCHNRKVINGKLYTLAYENACAINVDPIEKKPLMHFYPGMPIFSFGTAGCNFSCLNCQNWEISQASPDDIKSYKASPQALVDAAKQQSCKAIAYTYTEPTSFFEYMLETAKIAHHERLKNVMVSNGFINEKPLMDLIPYLDAANIDLKAFSSETYMQLTGGDLDPVLDTLEILKENNIWLEITNLIIPGWTDDMDSIKKMCKWLAKKGFEDYPLHFSRFHPAHKLKHVKSTPLKALLAARQIARDQGIKYIYIGNVPEIDGENTLCPSCSRLLIKRQAYRIISNDLLDNSCPACKHKIAGFWN